MSEEELLETVASLQDEIKGLQEELSKTEDHAGSLVRELKEEKAKSADLENQLDESNTTNGDSELRSLANTIRSCQQNGHPDYGKHVDHLLRKLGA